MNSTKTVPVDSVLPGTPEPMGSILSKLGVVWAGLFAGWTLGEIVLMATLVYTVLQIIMLIVERIIKPILAARRSVEVVRVSTFGD